MMNALLPTPTIDSDHPSVRAFASEHVSGVTSDVDRATRLYYAVRDGIRYDPYHLALTVPGMRASACLDSKRGWCVPKAILLAAALSRRPASGASP